MFTRVIFFGEPCSGKTTLARYLASAQKFVALEVSHILLYPLATCSHLPASKSAAFLYLRQHQGVTCSLSRADARAFFVRLQKTYGPTFLAEALDFLFNNDVRDLVFSGLRGVHNARWLQKRGYTLIYCAARQRDLIHRLCVDRQISRTEAAQELRSERRLYDTTKIAPFAHHVLDTSALPLTGTKKQLLSFFTFKECRTCINTSVNPSLTFTPQGYCNVCAAYFVHFDRRHLRRERAFLSTFKGSGRGPYDVLVGFSGGKDSTATLVTLQQMGFSPLAFTLNSGYYPAHILSRARCIAAQLGVAHETFDFRSFLRPVDLRCYTQTATLYDLPLSFSSRHLFLQAYQQGRQHYSVKCRHQLPFVRTCQLCRRSVIRAYYREAVRHGVSVVVLGMNEWAGLSTTVQGDTHKISAIRKLQPFKHKPPVYIVHLPFLLQRTLADTQKILRQLRWKIPAHEQLVESNSNSCLFARAAEEKATILLGFHPDTTRLAREVTCGFLTKHQAKKALATLHHSKKSVREVLVEAKILS